MKKGFKYTLLSLGSLVVLAGVGLGIMYVVSPYKVKRWLGIVSSYSDVFVDTRWDGHGALCTSGCLDFAGRKVDACLASHIGCQDNLLGIRPFSIRPGTYSGSASTTLSAQSLAAEITLLSRK